MEQAIKMIKNELRLYREADQKWGLSEFQKEDVQHYQTALRVLRGNHVNAAKLEASIEWAREAILYHGAGPNANSYLVDCFTTIYNAMMEVA